ncbi:MAG: type II toxin-antitoxin system VapC family toxin [Candidatus Anammoximicrobium sp.]|nr:type II toxin-antitoxin system VapC family toxin [Candidatus Anammoximicrobium sp.]
MIQFVAMANSATLVTRNISDFEGIDGLTISDWSRD